MASLFGVGLPFTFDGTTNHFATTTGGSATVANPTSADTVTFDSLSGTGTCTFTADMTCSTFSSSSANVTIAPGTHTINTSATTGTIWNWTAGTYTAGTSNITAVAATTGQSFVGGGKTYNNLTISGGVSSLSVSSSSNTFNNITFTGSASSGGGSLLFPVAGTTTITGTLTVNGNAQNLRCLLSGASSGSTASVNAAAVSLSNVDIISIIASGVSPWIGTSLGDCGNNSGITFDTPVTRYWVGGTGSTGQTTHWSASTGGASGATYPLPQDTAIYDRNSFSTTGLTVTNNVSRWWGNLDFSDVTKSFTFSMATSAQHFGSIVLNPNMISASAAGTITMRNDSTTNYSLTSNGVQMGHPFIVNCRNATTTFVDDYFTSSLRSLALTQGILTANGNVSCGQFASTANTRTINMAASSTWSLTGTGTVWDVTGGVVTVNPSTSTIAITDTSVTGKTFAGNGKTYNNLTVSGAVSAAAVTVTGANRFNGVTLQPNASIIWPASTITNCGGLYAVGTPGNLITMKSSIGGTPATLNYTGTGVVSLDYMSLQDITVTPATNTVGVLVKQTNKVAAGVVSFIGSQIKQIFHTMIASLSFIGKTVKAIARTLATGNLAFLGNLTKRMNLLGTVFTASLSFAGSIAKKVNKVASASLSFIGNLLDGTPTVFLLTAALSFVGGVTKKTTRSLPAATLSFIGAMTKKTVKAALTASLSFIGTLLAGAAHRLALTASLSFIGAFNKSIKRALSASLGFSGAINRARTKLLTATLNFSGNITRGRSKVFTATLGFVGSWSRFIAVTWVAIKTTISSGNKSTAVVSSSTATTTESGAKVETLPSGANNATIPSGSKNTTVTSGGKET